MATEIVDQIQPNILHKYSGAGTAAIADTSGSLSQPAKFHALTLQLGSAPATDGSLTLTLDSRVGGSYDTLLYAYNVKNLTSRVVDTSDVNLALGAADALDIAWANPDGVAYGFELTLAEGEV